RFTRVYEPDPWRPEMKAPAAEAGVTAGEYLLAVGGQNLTASDSLDRLFEGVVGERVTLPVGPRPHRTGAGDLPVVPIADEMGLRQRAWLAANRSAVTKATGGRVGYVYIPHTLDFEGVDDEIAAQSDRQALILDERFALGGDLPAPFLTRLR